MFKDTPNVEIIKVEDQLDTLHKIVVNFIFNEQIVGEMEFRYNEYTARAHATEFLKKISISTQPLQVLTYLNQIEVFFCINDRFEKPWEENH